MKRPWHTWTLFFLFLSVVITAMAWVTIITTRLQAENIRVQEEAALEETVRLALWRMDAAISPLIVEESARPHTDYNAVNPMASLFPNVDKRNAGDLVPSPLLAKPPTNVVLYFNGMLPLDSPKPQISSPQIPPPNLEDWGHSNFNIGGEVLVRNRGNLAVFAENVDIVQLQRDVGFADQTEPPMQVYQGIDNSPALQPPANPPLRIDAQIENPEPADTVQVVDQQQQGQTYAPEQVAMQQATLNSMEFQRRAGQTAQAQKKFQYSKQVRQSIQNDPDNVFRFVKGKPAGKGKSRTPPSRRPSAMLAGARESIMRPLWVKDMLLLSRNVTVDDKHLVQGAWLDWESIKVGLLAEVKDILPEADLVPVSSPAVADERRMLASLPVKLVPGPLAIPPAVVAPPLGTPLLVAWVGMIVSVSAVTALLFGAMSLSERRGAFVSAVTHELRTPLTTFRMYTEMLSEGLIKDKEKRKNYLVTLNRESNRLGHLVENVLAYARLERGTGARVLDNIKSGEVIERVRSTLAARVREAGMQLLIEYEAPHADAELRTDPSAVGQILLNLVDNACKYAHGTSDNRIHLSARKENSVVAFRVRDHGPGLKRSDIRAVFKPFRKSARDAAQSAPGVGLGLALCSRLARQLGGGLSYESSPNGGACFTLRLPAA